MKRMIKTLIIFLCCIPFLVNALDYENGVRRAKTYMTSDYKDTYQLYLIDGATKQLPFGFDETNKRHVVDSAFNAIGGSTLPTLGGFISRKEFELSKGGTENVSSYMYDGRDFWTLTGGGGSHYVVGRGTNASDSDGGPAVKVTEFVAHDTVVIGQGTKTDPWIFQPKYRITVTGKGGTINGSSEAVTQIVSKSSGSATFVFVANSGNLYSYNDCGLTNSHVDTTLADGRKQYTFTFEGINRNINCSIVAGKGIYKLDFDPNDATQPKTIYAKNGEKFYEDSDGKVVFNKLTSIPTRTGYTLGGYQYHINDTEKLVIIEPNGNVKVNTTGAITHDDTIETYWIPREFIVSLNANGGSVSPSSITVKYDSYYTGLPTPTRTGYTYSGWYTSGTGGDLIGASTQVKILSNQTLYAHWTANNYTLTYNANGGTVSPATTTVTYDGNYPSSMPTPTRRGYTFAGWYTAASGGNAVTGSTKMTTASNHSIYAHWRVNSYSCGGGYYLAANGISCTRCPGGSYCPGGTWNFNASSNQGLNSCPSGYTSGAGASGSGNCYMSVPGGKYVASARASSATNCPAGKYRAAHTVYYGNTSSCSNCSAGYYSRGGAASCTRCPSGQTSNAGASSCYNATIRCRKDGYWSTYNSCDACGANCGRLSCYGYCGWSNSCTYCTNIWDGCKINCGYYSAYREQWVSGETITRNASQGCPYGYYQV